ncbi:MAG: hypothetical protein JXR78_01205 [Victivallales bacterium]|nr:hypothetical protein [Victivallales bacterium]
MEKHIELLIFIVFIVASLISSFSKFRKTAIPWGSKDKAPKPEPDIQDEYSEDYDEEEYTEDIFQYESYEQAYESVAPVAPPATVKFHEPEHNIQPPASAVVAPQSRPPKVRHAYSNYDYGAFVRNNIRMAVVANEILGKPKAFRD